MMQGTFDATQFEPNQGGEAHPVGKFQAQITNTGIKPTKAGDGGMFWVEYTTPNGTIKDNYQLWNNNSKTVEIAQKQLSALCYATGVFRLQWENEGASLRGARCCIEVGQQIDRTTKEPNGYVEVKKVFDLNGNEPGKPASQQAPTPPLQQPANPSNGWGTQTANPAAASNGWASNQQAAQAPQGWTQQQAPQSDNKPPWAK